MKTQFFKIISVALIACLCLPFSGVACAETQATANVQSVSDSTYAKSVKLQAKKSYKVKKVDYEKLMKRALKYKGWRYQWGGRHERTSFDCAGLVIHVYNSVAKLGINRTYTNAYKLYHNLCTPISKAEAKPGDLVFWKGTYGSINYISHVGIYCGGDITYEAGDPIGFGDITARKNIKKKPAKYFFGRLKGVKVVNTDADVGATLDPGPTTWYKGKDYQLVYDYDYYIKRHPELEELYEGDDELVLKHFVKCGIPEGHQAKKNFNVKKYRAKNKDLRKKYKVNYKKYINHYLKTGYKQGRKTT